MIVIAAHAQGVVLPVLAHPGSKRDGILGERAGELRVAVMASPEKGKANVAIQSVLAEALACRAKQITLLSGETSRRKRFLIGGITPQELQLRLTALIAKPDRSRSQG
jgi:uncharacterized protein (TIGR00251 family)